MDTHPLLHAARGLLFVTGAACLLAAAEPARAQDDPRLALRNALPAWTTPPPPAAGARPGARSPGRLTQRAGPRGWSAEVRAAALHQVEADLDGGGRVAIDRLLAQGSLRYRPETGIPFSLSLGYRMDRYDFGAGPGRTFPTRPWSDVHGVSLGVPLFVPLGPRWFVLGVAAVRTTFEGGARAADGITGGGFAGASYKVNDDLRIGPGVGVFTQIEDDPALFPVLLVDWRLRPGLSLKTGRGLGATQGPGLFLTWEVDPRWTVSLGGRYDRLRFRLDERGVAPRGVGEESAFAVVLAARCEASPRLAWSASVGVAFGGELRLEDRHGSLLARTDYDTTVFLGLGLTLAL